MTCRWNYGDCQSDPSKCVLCVTDGCCYTAPKKRYKLKVNNQKADGRMGSHFEAANHQRNEAMLAKTHMTLNSGATAKEKGDEQISGIINVMEELKTQEPERGKGCKSFAIKRHWLNKLHVEALKENKEFWYLKFAFNEDDGASVHGFDEGNPAGNVFVTVEQDIIMSMVQTMVMDRQKAELCDARVKMYQKHAAASEAENVALKAKIEALEAKLEAVMQEHSADKLVEEAKKLT